MVVWRIGVGNVDEAIRKLEICYRCDIIGDYAEWGITGVANAGPGASSLQTRTRWDLLQVRRSRSLRQMGFMWIDFRFYLYYK